MKKKFSLIYFLQYATEGNLLRVISFLIVLTVVFYRRPDAFYNTQLWGEEGTFFYADAYNFGIKSIFYTCNGYFHLLPRFISWMCVITKLPLHIVPIVFSYSWLVIFLFLINFLWQRVTLPVQQKFYLVISMMLLPLQSEIVMNMTNVQWILSLFPLIIFSFPVKEKKLPQLVTDFCILIICGLTGPNFTVLLPFFLLQFILFKPKRNSDEYLPFLLLSVFFGLVGALFLFFNNGYIRTLSEFYLPDTGVIKYIFIQYSFIFVGAYCTDFTFTGMLIGVIIIAVLFLYFLISALKDKENRFKINCLLFGCLFLVSIIVSYGNKVEILNPYLYSPRNFFLPALALVWLLIIYSENLPYKGWMRAILMIWFAVQISWYIGSFTMKDTHLENYSEKLKSADTIRIPINPDGFSMLLNNKTRKR